MGKPITLREFKGVNRLDPFSIAPTYATDAKNVSTANYPALTVRSGLSLLGTVGTKVLGLGVWKDTELHAVFDDGTWRKWTGAAWTTLASGLSTSAEWTFCNFQGNLAQISLIGTNGVDPAKVYNGTTVSTLAGVPAGANYITQFADRLWAAVGNELHASSYRMADDWTTVAGDDADSWYAVVETPNGEQINGIKSGLTKLTITKPSSVHELYGYAPSDYSVRVVTLDVGQYGNKAAAALNGVLYQVNRYGIHQYAGGTLPSKAFSQPVQDYLDSIQTASQSESCAATDGKRVYFAIPLTSTTAPDTILAYDPQRNTWEKWDVSAVCFAKMGTELYLGDASGNVYQVTGTADNGTAIASRWVSVPLTAQSLGQILIITKVWVTANIPTGSSVSVYLSKQDSGDADWTLLKTLTAANALSTTPIPVASTTQPNAQWCRIKIEGSGPFTLREITLDVDTKQLV